MHRFIVLRGNPYKDSQPDRIQTLVGGRAWYFMGACSGRRTANPIFDEEPTDTTTLRKVLRGRRSKSSDDTSCCLV